MEFGFCGGNGMNETKANEINWNEKLSYRRTPVNSINSICFLFENEKTNWELIMSWGRMRQRKSSPIVFDLVCWLWALQRQGNKPKKKTSGLRGQHSSFLQLTKKRGELTRKEREGVELSLIDCWLRAQRAAHGNQPRKQTSPPPKQSLLSSSFTLN